MICRTYDAWCISITNVSPGTELRNKKVASSASQVREGPTPNLLSSSICIDCQQAGESARPKRRWRKHSWEFCRPTLVYSYEFCRSALAESRSDMPGEVSRGEVSEVLWQILAARLSDEVKH